MSSIKDRTVDGARYDVVVVGAGSAGIATAASLLKRKRGLRIALIVRLRITTISQAGPWLVVVFSMCRRQHVRPWI